jgi:hypothetical protein
MRRIDEPLDLPCRRLYREMDMRFWLAQAEAEREGLA